MRPNQVVPAKKLQNKMLMPIEHPIQILEEGWKVGKEVSKKGGREGGN